MQFHADVAILGGGPAGSAAATLLAQRGHRVILCEKERYPHFKIGESLLPHSLELFEKLGVSPELERHAFEKFGGEIATACGRRVRRFYFEEALQLCHRKAYQVERAWFDQMLLRRATEAGVEVRQPCAVNGLKFDDDGVTLTSDASEIRAKYLIDCSGRNAVVGQHFDLKRRYEHLRKFSVYAHFEGVQRDPGRDGTLTKLVRARDQWFWLIPLDERRTSVGVVMDLADYRAGKRTPEATLDHAIAESALMSTRMAVSRRITDVHATSDYSFRNTRLHGKRWLLAGDAAGFIDPIFSTGVFIALHSAEQAASAVDSALRHPLLRPIRFASYGRGLNRLMDRYLRFVTAWYTNEFVDVFTTPKPPFQIPQAVNSVLGGNIHPRFGVWWRLQLFYLVLWIQKRHPIIPKLEEQRDEPAQPLATTA